MNTLDVDSLATIANFLHERDVRSIACIDQTLSRIIPKVMPVCEMRVDIKSSEDLTAAFASVKAFEHAKLRITTSATYENIQLNAKLNWRQFNRIYSLCISGCTGITDLSPLRNIPVIDLSNCKMLSEKSPMDVTPLSNAYMLNLTNTAVHDVSPLVNVSVLNLKRCTSIKNLHVLADVEEICLVDIYREGLTKQEEVYNLKNVKVLDFGWWEHLGNISQYGYATVFKLYYVWGIRSAPELWRVSDLDLSGCDLQDVSALGRVDILNLSDCKSLTDVSALGGVRVLTLESCNRITDVSALGGVRVLNLSHCICVTDVSALGNVIELNLSHCRRITDVNSLGRVRVLDLHDCQGITDVSGLGRVRSLNLRNCPGITDVSGLGRVRELDLSDCPGITDVSCLGRVRELNLTGCTGVRDTSAVKCVQMLSVKEFSCYNCDLKSNPNAFGYEDDAYVYYD